MLIFLIKSNRGTAIFGIIFTAISLFIYIKGYSYLSERGVDTSFGLVLNRILCAVGIVLYVVFVIMPKKKIETTETE